MVAFALVLILEGLMPALNPEGWRRAVQQLAEMPASTIRNVGFGLLIVGVIMFHLAG